MLQYCRLMQHLQWDQARALAPDRSPFSSLEDAARRLFAYHVFQGALPSSDDLRKGTVLQFPLQEATAIATFTRPTDTNDVPPFHQSGRGV